MSHIISDRLLNHLFLNSPKTKPKEVVKHLLCMQAQDFTQHLRAIASRSSSITKQNIEDAYNRGDIVRTWTQRGTIHVVAAEDAARMVKLCASKTLSGFKRRREYLGISNEVAEQALQIIQEMLSGNKALTRQEIGNNLKSSGIDMGKGWIYHFLCYSGTLGITVQGPINNDDQAFLLTKDWIKNPLEYNEDEALKEICLRYFSSHGPATIADLQRWSGLGTGQIKKGITLAGDTLDENNGYYYHRDNLLGSSQTSQNRRTKIISLHTNDKIHFLAGFDERLLGYKDRTATLDTDHHTLVDVSRNGVFKPTFMIDGKTVGTRSIKHKKNTCEILLKPFGIILDSDYSILQKAIEPYEQFIEKQIIVTIV